MSNVVRFPGSHIGADAKAERIEALIHHVLHQPLGLAQLEPETAIQDLTHGEMGVFFLSAHHWLAKASAKLGAEYDAEKGGEVVTLTLNNREAEFLVRGLERLTVAMEILAVRERNAA